MWELLGLVGNLKIVNRQFQYLDSNQIKLVHLISAKCHQEPESLSVIAKALLVYPKYI